MLSFPSASVSPEWLSYVLRSAGILPVGSAIVVQTKQLTALNSTVERLVVQYSADAHAEVPRQLVLKRNANHDGMCEALFYQLVATLPGRLPVVARCYGAAYDPESGDSFCLLEDLSTSHSVPTSDMPTDAQLDQMVDALVQFHAYWWQHPRFGHLPDLLEVRPWYRDATFHAQHVERRTRELNQFLSTVGANIPGDLIKLLQQALLDLPQLWERFIASRVTGYTNLTLTNGDCYFVQFLCSHSEIGQTYLIDFQDASVNFGPYDLVYMFATFWTSKQRHENNREMRLLRRYHHGLLSHGIQGYDWHALVADYRLMLCYMLFDPVWNATSGSNRTYWWPKLDCLAQAYRDWDCANL